MDSAEPVSQWLDRVRKQRPLVHNITNIVVTNVVANALLAVGASPVMAYATEEVADMARIASALALNMGTLDDRVVRAMLSAGHAANAVGAPVVFDPVGVGATAYRNETATQLIESVKLTVLRGNQGEIGFLLGAGGEVQGVDSLRSGEQLPRAMKEWAAARGCVVIATGPVDYVTDGTRVFALRNGHSLLSFITGSGCQATGLIGAFCGVAGAAATVETYADASVAALTCLNVAGELAAGSAPGPGSFQAALFDELYRLDGATVDRLARVDLLEV